MLLSQYSIITTKMIRNTIVSFRKVVPKWVEMRRRYIATQINPLEGIILRCFQAQKEVFQEHQDFNNKIMAGLGLGLVVTASILGQKIDDSNEAIKRELKETRMEIKAAFDRIERKNPCNF